MIMPLILSKYSNLRNFYNSEKEFIDHLLSGEVTMPVKEVVELFDQMRPLDSTRSLVSFGNYLFERYGVQVYSNDGQNVPLYKREVTDADLSNWTVGQEIERRLPSAHQIDDEVTLCFGNTGNLKGCKIIKVHFSDSKVLYDVTVPVVCEDLEHNVHTAHTRLYNVDSCFVEKTNK